MALRKKAEAFDCDFKESVKHVRSIKFKNMSPRKLSVSTMSIVSLLNADTIKLERVAQRFDDADVQDLLTEVIPKAYLVSLKRHDADKSFSNSVILKFKGHRNNIAVKIFSNGKLHITGPRSAVENLEAIDLVCLVMDVIYKKEIGTFKAHDFYVQMVNTDFCINHTLDKDNVHNVLRKHDMEAWIPEKHSAVSLKIRIKGRVGINVKDKVTVLIFASGEVIITGLKTGKELITAYDTVTKLLDKEMNNVRSSTMSKKKTKVRSESESDDADADDEVDEEVDEEVDADVGDDDVGDAEEEKVRLRKRRPVYVFPDDAKKSKTMTGADMDERDDAIERILRILDTPDTPYLPPPSPSS